MIEKPNEQVKILIVDDNPVNIDLLLELLKDYDVRTVISGELALETAQKELPDIILLDITMPGINGFETCQQLKRIPKTKNVPVIFLSASKDTSSIVKGFKVGGVDYITKPYNTEEVQVRIHTHIQLKFALEQLAYHDDYDELSGALKREVFINNSHTWLLRAKKVKLPLSLFMVSVNNLESINKQYGYQMGDNVVKSVVIVAKKVITLDYVIARFIGGEFIILFKDISKEKALKEVKKLQQSMRRLAFKKHPDFRVSISLAMAESTATDGSIEKVIKRVTDNVLFT